MATIRDFNLPRLMPSGATGLHGHVTSSRSGTVYTIATDARGVVSCSCIGWLHDSGQKKGEPRRAIQDRWCSHLRAIRNGTGAFAPRYMPTDDRAEKLATARDELAKITLEITALKRQLAHLRPHDRVYEPTRTRLAELREQVMSYSEAVGYSAVAALMEGDK